MKYLNFRSSASRLESVTCKKKKKKSLLKIALRHNNFSKNFTTSVEQRYWKIHPDGCFWWELCFGILPEWLLLKNSCKDKFILRRTYTMKLFLHRWLNFSFNSFLLTFKTCIQLWNVNEIFQSTIIKVFQKKKILPDFW